MLHIQLLQFIRLRSFEEEGVRDYNLLYVPLPISLQRVIKKSPAANCLIVLRPALVSREGAAKKHRPRKCSPQRRFPFRGLMPDRLCNSSSRVVAFIHAPRGKRRCNYIALGHPGEGLQVPHVGIASATFLLTAGEYESEYSVITLLTESNDKPRLTQSNDSTQR